MIMSVAGGIVLANEFEYSQLTTNMTKLRARKTLSKILELYKALASKAPLSIRSAAKIRNII